MIVDRLENWKMYFAGSDWEIIARFLASLNSNAPDGEYPLKGDLIFARVMSYETHNPDQVKFEAHRSYIDIQSVLVGGEGITWHPVDRLKVSEMYDVDKDVEFYLAPENSPVQVSVSPGYFVALFPHDAHMPQLKVGGRPPWVKKVVVKVHTDLYPGRSVDAVS